jgi:hypothetical protein
MYRLGKLGFNARQKVMKISGELKVIIILEE